MSGQGNGRPVPGLGGTGRVADELYLIAHHELTGRAHLAPRAVGLGLAGALLAELILADAITVAAGAVVAAVPGQADDQLTAAVAAQIAGEDTHPVADWLAFLARTAAGEVAARLAHAGYLAPPPRRSWRATRWVPVDPDCAFAPVHAITSGIVHTTPDRSAAALWLPTSTGLPGPPPGYGQRLAAVTGPWHGRFAAFDAALERHHPAGTAHHHLALLAVDPGHQGHGTGSMLLRAYHATLDDGGIPAYLEAATVRTRRLYRRHGYMLRPDAPIRLPDGGPLMWPMWRQPRRTSSPALP